MFYTDIHRYGSKLHCFIRIFVLRILIIRFYLLRDLFLNITGISRDLFTGMMRYGNERSFFTGYRSYGDKIHLIYTDITKHGYVS